MRRRCQTPGCPRWIERGQTRCPQHAADHAATDNAKRQARRVSHGRNTAAWHTLRTARLEHAGHTCELNIDDRCTRIATTAHLRPSLNGDHLAAELDDLRAACSHCHGVIDGARATRSARVVVHANE